MRRMLDVFISTGKAMAFAFVLGSAIGVAVSVAFWIVTLAVKVAEPLGIFK